ncbi:SPFH domain-containing protein [Actinorugispora endophytica]|uniref:SPFH domain/Band 7 family protein n=1 Tax=Actinorugispora endophytica TaxID=1605990 RepID=A0A4R6UG90_9ACTN|nr:SPFH domain-containing protein [Actinorugispora endophytica]TDQ44269.1 SPFH domain/Band 7 family protein [Actinorugispora endophytica]
MNSSPRRLAAASAVVLMATAGCSVSTNPDEIGLEYDAGVFSDTTFDSCVSSGNRQYYGPGDQAFVYPGGQRTYTFSPEEGVEAGTATVVSRDDLELTVEGVVTFSLNPTCETFQEWHERIGLKYDADTDEGWVRMLRTYIGAPLNRALDDASKSHDWRDLYTSAEAKAEWEIEVGELLSGYIAEQGGGDFFCSPNFTGAEDQECGTPQLTIQQPVPPDDVRAALIKAQQAVEETAAQEEENKRVEMEMEAIEMLVDELGPEGAILWQALKEGDVEFLPVPEGGSINVPPRGGE